MRKLIIDQSKVTKENAEDKIKEFFTNHKFFANRRFKKDFNNHVLYIK